MITLNILPKKIYKFYYDNNGCLDELVSNLSREMNSEISSIRNPRFKIFDFERYPIDFINFLNESIKICLEKELIKYESYKIVLNWINIHDRIFNRHTPHTHQNSIYSGVYYYETVNLDGISFYDKNPVIGDIIDIVRKDNELYHECKERIPSNTGDLILFRSYYKHGVDDFTIKTKSRRISFSFNIDLQGIGSYERLTYR